MLALPSSAALWPTEPGSRWAGRTPAHHSTGRQACAQRVSCVAAPAGGQLHPVHEAHLEQQAGEALEGGVLVPLGGGAAHAQQGAVLCGAGRVRQPRRGVGGGKSKGVLCRARHWMPGWGDAYCTAYGPYRPPSRLACNFSGVRGHAKDPGVADLRDRRRDGDSHDSRQGGDTPEERAQAAGTAPGAARLGAGGASGGWLPADLRR